MELNRNQNQVIKWYAIAIKFYEGYITKFEILVISVIISNRYGGHVFLTSKILYLVIRDEERDSGMHYHSLLMKLLNYSL